MLKHMYFLNCTPIKAILLPQEWTTKALLSHSGSDFTRVKYLCSAPVSPYGEDFNPGKRLLIPITLTQQNPLAFPLLTRCGNSSFQSNPPKK